jgi:glucokinase
MEYFLGIDLGGTRVKVLAATAAGNVLEKQAIEFRPDVEMDWAEQARLATADVQARLGQAASIGVSAPGLASRDCSCIEFMPGRLQGLEGLSWTKLLQSPSPVPVVNDAHAALLAEFWSGAARDVNYVIMLTLGTGVGGAAISDGKLLRGAIGRAGHLGHNCLNISGPPDVVGTPGSLEDAIGNCTVRQRSGGKFNSTRELVEAHARGDSQASEIWLRSIRALACALASFINILDPEMIILGGGISLAGPHLFGPLAKEMDAIEWRPGNHRVRIVPAQLDDYAGALGAAFWGKQRLNDTRFANS